MNGPEPNDPELLERLRPSYRLLSARRLSEWLELMHPEVEAHQMPSILGSAKVFRGREGTLAMLAELDEVYERIEWTPLEARDLGGGVYLVRVSVRGLGRSSEVSLDAELAHRITVRDGLTMRLEVFRDWDSALAAAQQPRQPR